MKKYLIPEMEVELFDGRDLFEYATGGTGGVCPCETGVNPNPGCPGDLGFDPCNWHFGPEIFD